VTTDSFSFSAVSPLHIGIVGGGFVGSAVAYGSSLLPHTTILIHDTIASKGPHSIHRLAKESNIIFVCVPTPGLHSTGAIDVTAVANVVDRIARSVPEGADKPVIAIKSTVIPGTVDQLIEQYKYDYIVSNPEFLTQRTAKLDFINPARVVIGAHLSDAGEILERYYRLLHGIECPIIRTTPAAAEMIKYISNCFFATKISFMNEMHQIASKVAPGQWDTIVEGLQTSGRVANCHLSVPGPDGKYGYGGGCFPKDMNALIALATQLGVEPTVLEAARNKNLEVRNAEDEEETS
jgi:UDPglucose 6-dehydrogenase